MDTQRWLPFIRVEQAKRLGKTLLLSRAVLRQRFDELRGEVQRLVAVDLLTLPRLPRQVRRTATSLWVFASEQICLGELEHISRLDVGEGALQ